MVPSFINLLHTYLEEIESKNTFVGFLCMKDEHFVWVIILFRMVLFMKITSWKLKLFSIMIRHCEAVMSYGYLSLIGTSCQSKCYNDFVNL